MLRTVPANGSCLATALGGRNVVSDARQARRVGLGEDGQGDSAPRGLEALAAGERKEKRY